MLNHSTAFTVPAFEPLFPPLTRAEEILLEFPQALLVLQPDRQQLFANERAELLAASAYTRDMHGRVTSIGQLNAPLIEALLQGAKYGHGAQAGVWFPKLQKAGWLSASRLPSGIASSTDWPLESLLLLVHLDEPKLTQPARLDALCQQCALTKTERYVLMLLADGMAAQEIARQLALQVSTIRTHIRNLLGKTGSCSMMQLVRRVGIAELQQACQ